MKFVVAFSSPKRSSAVVTVAAKHAMALNAELIILRILPDAEKVGVIAQLIATDRPQEKAQKQIDMVVSKLKEKGVNARGNLRVGEVASGLAKAAVELGASMLFVGTTNLHQRQRFYMTRDPIVNYIVDNCPVSLCLVRADDPSATPSILESPTELEQLDPFE
ncbi:MAG: universal stress protein [Candidatus Obscuribacterales bacterium]|nr:universal stress protein [Candidatus Obscuribacterales bacterium]